MTGISSLTNSSATSNASNSTNALANLSQTADKFLTLLTTQLKNQDPLAPMDSTQFTQQLVAFTGVEQQINGNKKLDQLIALNQGDQLTSAVGFIGTQVEAVSSQAWLDPSGVASQIGYALPAQVAAVMVQVQDSTGAPVRNLTGTILQGHNVVTWDGKNDYGYAMPSGVYSVSLQAIGQDQKPITNVVTSIIGTVTNIASDPTNGTELSIGEVQVPLSGVTSVKKPS